MTDTHNALALANELDTKAQALGCPLDRFSAVLRLQHTRIAELEAENKQLRILASGGIDLFERYSTFKAKCKELEAMLDAVGAGGVGQSIKPQVQADAAQEPVAWRVRPFNYGIGHEGVDALTTRKEQCEMWERKGWKVEPLYAAPQPPVQQEPFGYFKVGLFGWTDCDKTDDGAVALYAAPQPARQPLTESQVKELAKKHPAEDLCRWSYGMGIKDAEAAHGITESQQ